MQRQGRIFQVFLDLSVAWGVALALALALPYSVWQSIGQTGAALVLLTYAITVTAFVTLRHRRHRIEVAGATEPLREAA
jgi:hypothetical protein